MNINNLIKTTLLLLCFLSTSQAGNLFDPLIMANKQPNQVNGGVFATFFDAGIENPVGIPDNNSTGINIPIEVDGLEGNINSFSLILDIDHSYVGDLTATLTAPGGIAQLVIFSGVGQKRSFSSSGHSSNLQGLYAFNDQAPSDFWAVAAMTGNGDIIPPGSYRTSTAGSGNHLFGGCTTRLNGAFKGLKPVQSNGTWVLNIKDENNNDSGQILSAGILIEGVIEDLIFESNFERLTTPYQMLPASDLLGNCKKAQYDFTGTGYSDFVLTRENQAGELIVDIITNEGGAITSIGSGASEIISTDLLFIETEMTSGGDFDGDGIKDFVFKRPLINEKSQYLIRRSSRPNDLPALFKIREPDPTGNLSIDLQIGDYDGDGLDDFAWLTSKNAEVGGSFLQIVESLTFGDRRIITGSGTTADFKPSGGFDKNGDQISDLIVYTSNNDATDPRLIIKAYDGSDGSLLYDSDFGIFSTDTSVLPGTYITNGLVDIAIFNPFTYTSYDTANFAGEDFYTLPFNPINFGIDLTPITGDYDGDGIDDFGYWAISDVEEIFAIRPSSNPNDDNTLIIVSPANAIDTDLPLANSRVR